MKIGKSYTLPLWVIDIIIIAGEPVAYFAGMVQATDSKSIFGFVLICLWLMIKKFKNMLEDKPKEE
jgi:hypothetical protein